MYSRRRVALQRSQIAFACGAWIGALTIVMSSDSKTVSRLAVSLAPLVSDQVKAPG